MNVVGIKFFTKDIIYYYGEDTRGNDCVDVFPLPGIDVWVDVFSVLFIIMHCI